MKSDNLRMLLSGMLQIDSVKGLRIELQNESKILSTASVNYASSENDGWVVYDIPVPSYTDIVSSSNTLEVWVSNADVKYKLKELPTSKILHELQAAEDIALFMDNITPSIGFIGGAFNDALTLDVYMSIKNLTVKLPNKKTYLNFHSLVLFDTNGKRISQDKIKAVTYSSSMTENVNANKLLNVGGFHSKLDESPWVKLEFCETIFIAKLHFFNRNDKWGLRAKGLEITGEDKIGIKHILYQQYAQENKIALFNQFQKMLGHKAFNIRLDRITVLDHLIEYFHKVEKSSDFEVEEVQLILQVLSSWNINSDCDIEVLRRELKLLAVYLVFSMHVRISLNIQCFENLLERPSFIQQLEDDINHLRSKFDSPLIEITKHGTSLANKLTANPALLLESMQTLIEDLEQLELRPCIAYGTLLGAYRNNEFIAHDDDVDLLIELPEQNLSVKEALNLHLKLASQLDPKKYVVNRASERDDRLNLHVYVIKTAVLLDLFPYWYNGNEAILHMERMEIRGIPNQALQGRKLMKLYDFDFPAPALPALLLEERYGKGWEHPDKFHEWPWKLKDDDFSKPNSA